MATDPSDDDRLSSCDVAQSAALDRVRERLVADARSWGAQVRELSGILARAELAGGHARHALVLELAGSWQVGQLTAQRWLVEADRFCLALPATLAMLETGGLLRHQAAVLLHRTRHCPPELARLVEEQVLPQVAGLCPADLQRRVDRAVLRLESEQADAAAAEQRHAEAAAGRRTFVKPDLDGLALAAAVLTAEQAVAWAAGMDRLERRERLADRQAGIGRTADQRRADLFAALPAMVLAGLTQTTQDSRSGSAGPWTFPPGWSAAQLVLNVHVPVSTVLELSREPGSLDRYGPVSAEHVRLLRPTALRRVLVDADTGRPIAVDDRTTPCDPDPARAREQVQAMLAPAVVVDAEEAQHDPSARLARLIDLRDGRCGGPGCSAASTHRDHLEPYPHGPTSASNLNLLSARCHIAKHHGWTLQRHPDGSTTWHSPLHRRYHRPGPHQPPPRVDIYAEPPPLRPPPATAPPGDIHDGTAARGPQRPGTPRTGRPRRRSGRARPLLSDLRAASDRGRDEAEPTSGQRPSPGVRPAGAPGRTLRDMPDDVHLADLEVITRWSLAVRGATAPRAELVTALQADLDWLREGAVSAEPAPQA